MSRLKLLIGLIIIFSCGDLTQLSPVFIHRNPSYGIVELKLQKDTLSFALDENVYNDISSFNVFSFDDTDLISFYDQRSSTINIYTLDDKKLFKKFWIKNFFKKHRLYKTTVFIKNFDSIFIINKTTLYLFDSTGKKKMSIDFLKNPPYSWAVFDNNSPPIIKNDKLYAIVRPNVKYKSLDALRKWKVLYEFDLKKGKAQLCYNLPIMYRKHLYGYHFLDYSFCFNKDGRFVFSFPADTLTYETDLYNYHNSYSAKSSFHKIGIHPIDNNELDTEMGLKQYATQYSYGAMYFDPYKKYYLRQVKHSVTENEFLTKKMKRKETVLILDEAFKIIGESSWPQGVSFNSIFFTSKGEMYARINFKDENALHFAHIDYMEK